MVSAVLPGATGVAPIEIGKTQAQQTSVIGLTILPVQVLALAVSGNKSKNKVAKNKVAKNKIDLWMMLFIFIALDKLSFFKTLWLWQ